MFFSFFEIAPKKGQGGRRLHWQRPQSDFEEDEAKEATEKKNLNKKKILKILKNSDTIFFFFFSEIGS